MPVKRQTILDNVKVGDKYEMLEVIDVISTKKGWAVGHGYAKRNLKTFLCKCSCGNQINVSCEEMFRKKSCGCLVGKHLKKENRISA